LKKKKGKVRTYDSPGGEIFNMHISGAGSFWRKRIQSALWGEKIRRLYWEEGLKWMNVLSAWEKITNAAIYIKLPFLRKEERFQRLWKKVQGEIEKPGG